MAGALEGLNILVPESRELDLFVGMLEAEGAVALRCPLVRILDLEDTAAAEAWIEQLASGMLDDLILLTGEGLRRLLAIAESRERRPAFMAALGRVRIITRGPKPVRVLHQLGLAPDLAAAIPTSQGVLDALAGESILGRRIGVQLYPEGGAGSLPHCASAARSQSRSRPIAMPRRLRPRRSWTPFARWRQARSA